jgi:predicted RNA-binding protein with RPS1 domain
MKTKLDVLKEINVEYYRLQKKLALAIKEQSDPNNCSSRHYASCKRAALNFKNELTKLTQDSKYRYSS